MAPQKSESGHTKAHADHIEMVASTISIDEENTFDGGKSLTLWQATKSFPRIVLFSLAACSAGMTFGYDNIVNGASISLPSFLIYFGAMTAEHKLYLPSIWTALFSAMSALMQAVGGITAAPIADRLGRKKVIMASCVVSAGGVALQFAAHSRGVLLAGKMVNGFAIGAALGVATTWASEISPVRLRGPIQSGIVLFTVLVQALGLVVIRQHIATILPSAFRTVFAIQWAFCGLTFILFALVPESPTWLIMKDRHDKARSAVARLYGQKNDHEAWYDRIAEQVRVEAVAEQATGIGGFLELYKGSVLKRTLTVHLLFFGVGLSGASFLAQSIYFLITAGLEPIHTFDVSIGGFALALFGIIGSWFWIERLGRRSLWLVGVVGNIVVMFIIGGLYWAPGKGPLWAIAILMNIMIFWQNSTLTSMSWVIAGEISPYRLRGKNQAVAVLSNSLTTWLFNFIVPYMYNIDSGNLGARTALVFGAASVVLLILSYPLVPDLRGLSTTEIDWLYENKISPRRFQEYAHGKAAEEVATAAAAKVSASKAQGV